MCVEQARYNAHRGTTPLIPFGILSHRPALPPQHVSFAQRHTLFVPIPLPPFHSAMVNRVFPHIGTVDFGLSRVSEAEENQNASALNITSRSAARGNTMIGASTFPVYADENTQPSHVTHHVCESRTEPFDLNPNNSNSISPEYLSYTDFSRSIIHHSPLTITTPLDTEIYERIITPYSAGAFAELLNSCNLSEKYPLLVNNLSYGFPIGEMPTLTKTIIIPNHPSISEHLDKVHEYLNTELEAHRMSGPFSQGETERILQGFFYCSPFVVVTQDQGPNLPQKTRICRHLSKDAHDIGSVNSFIDKEEFPTRFDMPVQVADAVSPSFS